MTSPSEIHDTSLRHPGGDFVTLRLRAAELAEGLRLLDRVGFASIDAFGGASLLSTLTALGEDPWHRLRTIRGALTRTPLQVAIRGTFLFGRRPAPTDTIRATLKRLRDLGVDRIETIDSRLGLARTSHVARLAKYAGLYVTGSVLLSREEAANPLEPLLEAAEAYASDGADAIGLHDPAGAILPARLSDLVDSYRRHCSLPLRLHVHGAGMPVVSRLQAGLRAGASGADSALAALSTPASPPPAQALELPLHGSRQPAGIDHSALEEASVWFEDAKIQDSLHAEVAPPEGVTTERLVGKEDTKALSDRPGGTDAGPGDSPSEEDRLAFALFPGMDRAGTGTPSFPLVAGSERGLLRPPRRLRLDRKGESVEVALEGVGTTEDGRRILFLRIEGQSAAVEVDVSPRGETAAYVLHHHGRRHVVEVVEVLHSGRASLPVLLRADGQFADILVSLPCVE